MFLKEKISLVTGAGQGIGKSIVKKLAAEGSFVIINDINLENANKVMEELEKENIKSMALKGDVGSPGSVAEIFKAIRDKFGKIDILVNNAGINRDSMLHKMSNEDWDAVIRVNLSGAFYCMREFASIMREQNTGRIINISSIAAMGNIGQMNYSASKAGLIGMTKTAARELARKNITVNAICPGFIETEMTKAVPEKIYDLMVSKIALGRIGKPQEIANLVAFLASDDAAYITGEVIGVTGGMVL